MARVTMRVIGRAYNGMSIGSGFSVTEAQAATLEEAGKAERVRTRAMTAEAPAKPAKKAARTYRRRDMKAAD